MNILFSSDTQSNLRTVGMKNGAQEKQQHQHQQYCCWQLTCSNNREQNKNNLQRTF